MRKRIIFIIFGLIVFYPLPAFAVFTDKVIEDVRSAIVALYLDEDLMHFRASGFFIDPSGTIITAKHVVKNYPKLWARLYDGRKLELIPIQFQENNDLAIMLPNLSENEKAAFPFLKFSDAKNLAVGQPVMTIGNSSGGLWQILYGSIEDLHRKIIVENDNLVFTVIGSTMIIPKGFSGSPLVDENGEVLGMNISVAKISSGYNSSYAISLIEIKSFIKEFYKKSLKSPPL